MSESRRTPPLIPDFIAHNATWRGDFPAVIFAGEELSWRDFAERVAMVANGLLTAGINAGDRIGILMDNVPATVEVIFGSLAAGAVAVPLNVTVSDASLDIMLDDADVSAIFVSHGHHRRLSDATLSNARLLVIDNGHSDGWTEFAAWRDVQESSWPKSPSPFDLCNIIYSSGTTGDPKGIVHSHGARADWAHDLAHALRYHSGARTLIATGLYSNITWVGMLPTLMLGGTIHIEPTFNAAAIIKTIENCKITHFSMVPVQFQRIVEDASFASDSLASVHSAMTCGSPMPTWLKTKMLEILPKGFFELYGSTEGIITTLAPDEAIGRMGTVGRPIPAEQLAILDANDTNLPWGEAGEVVALSRFSMEGYWRKPQATADAVWIDASGRQWLRSGDIGRIDAEGYLTITDRKKDLIISGGQNIYPADIESVLMEHPQVSDCAVIGIPSDKWGETPLALLVLAGNATTSKDELLQWANSQLGKQQRISFAEVRESLPRNANGKLLKRELRAEYLVR